jgi:hypothetical protein
MMRRRGQRQWLERAMPCIRLTLTLGEVIDSDFECEFEYDVKRRIDRKEDRKAAFPRRQEQGGNVVGKI